MESKKRSRSFIVGTAGHVDHGKSELVQQITSVNPDRLPEEKQRKMTIVLGFAPLDLPSGRRCGVVDVPGHEKLVKKMLVGAVGFDLVLFVVACDEGPQRQSYEHLDILNFLGIKNGIIVLNKSDLPHDEEKLMADVQKLIKDTTLENAPIIKVSSITGDGIPKLLEIIDETLNNSTPRSIDMPIFMPIDRKFNVKGIGLIVGGTLWQGALKIGDTVEVFSSGKTFKVKNLESFEEALEIAPAGNRYAVRLQGAEKEDIETGHILLSPNRFNNFSVFDAKIQLTGKLKKYTRLKIHIDTIEQEVDIIRIGTDYIRIHLESPLPLTRGTRFILRKIAPNDTIGGGIVIEADPKYKPNHEDTLKRLESISQMTDEEFIFDTISRNGNQLTLVKDLRPKINCTNSHFTTIINQESFVKLNEFIILKKNLNNLVNTFGAKILNYFQENKDTAVILASDAKKRILPDIETTLFTRVLNDSIREPLKIEGSNIIDNSKKEQRSPLEDKLEKMFTLELFSPPKFVQIRRAKVFDDQLHQLDQAIAKFITNKIIVKATSELYFHKSAITKGFAIMKSIIEKNKVAKLSDFRDTAGTSRKYAQALLELLDALGYTRRQGDVRILGPRKP